MLSRIPEERAMSEPDTPCAGPPGSTIHVPRAGAATLPEVAVTGRDPEFGGPGLAGATRTPSGRMTCGTRFAP